MVLILKLFSVLNRCAIYVESCYDKLKLGSC